MNIPLQRMIEGIIATMRADVIPHVSDPYARGQAVGVIDLLNNLAPRVEWAQAPLATQIAQKKALLERIRALVPIDLPVGADAPGATAEDLLALRGALDASIGDAVATLWPRRHEPEFAEAAKLVQAHLHDEMAAEMKITRKPLFAEIASGADSAKSG